MSTNTHLSTLSDDTSKEQQLKQFKEEVKSWMRKNRIKASDIASWAGKSVGTVKNWLYTPLNITDENQKTIHYFMEQYDRGFISINGDGINKEAPNKSVGFIELNLNELNLSESAPEYWCMAAEVRTDLLNNDGRGYYSLLLRDGHITFAKWFTELIMQRTKEVIAPALYKEEDKGNRFELKQYIKESPSSLEPIREGVCIEFITNTAIYVPVIIDQWKPVYLIAAAGIRKQTSGQFILSSLQEAAEQMNYINLHAFIEE